MTIKELCRISHKIAYEKGFWGEWKETFKGNMFFKTERPIPELLMLIVSELGEACHQVC